MEERKRLFGYFLFAAQLFLSSTQVLRIGKRNSLRTVLMSFPCVCKLTEQSERKSSVCVTCFIFPLRFKNTGSAMAVLHPNFQPLYTSKVIVLLLLMIGIKLH